MASQYTRGGMEIDGQQSTFSSVIKAGVSSSLVLAYSIVFLTFAFATGSGWFTAIGVALAVGIVGGVVMKQGPWYWLFYRVSDRVCGGYRSGHFGLCRLARRRLTNFIFAHLRDSRIVTV